MLLAADQTLDSKGGFDPEILPDGRFEATQGDLAASSVPQLRAYGCYERQDGMAWLIWMFRPCALPLRIHRPQIGRRREAGRIVRRSRNARGEKYIRRVGLVHECEK